ncbi:MAG: hypothetical protein Q9169_004374 [Polycauliona sp. 2 TL-2023]
MRPHWKRNPYLLDCEFILQSDLHPDDLPAVHITASANTRDRYMKAITRFLTEEDLSLYMSTQKNEYAQMLNDILTRPDEIYMHLQRTSASIMTTLLYGKKCLTFKNSLAEEFYEGIRLFNETNDPGVYPPIELLPWVAHIPRWLAPWAKHIERNTQVRNTLYYGLVDELREKEKRGKSEPCYLDFILDNQENLDMSYDLDPLPADLAITVSVFTYQIYGTDHTGLGAAAEIYSGYIKTTLRLTKHCEFELVPVCQHISNDFMTRFDHELVKVLLQCSPSETLPRPRSIKFGQFYYMPRDAVSPVDVFHGQPGQVYVTVAITSLHPESGWNIFYEGSHLKFEWMEQLTGVPVPTVLKPGQAIVWHGDLAYTYRPAGGGCFLTLVFE